jgi:hypothetical protein
LPAGLLDTLRKTTGVQSVEVVDAVQTVVAGKRVGLVGVARRDLHNHNDVFAAYGI